jgi:peptidoglycan/xylan/chitin deacetylase (PgdA/CDA1 family)
MRAALRNAVFGLIRFSGLPLLWRHTLRRKRVTVLVYHDLPLEIARRHFPVLRARYNIISLADYLEARAKDAFHQLPPRPLVITFDDGHKSNFDLKELLAEFARPVTIFLCSGIVGTHRHYWWTHARDAAEAQACKQMSNADRLVYLRERDYANDRQYPDRQALSVEEIEQMKGLVDFQAHTVSHPILPACEAAEAEREMMDCKTKLERNHSVAIRALAFPNGSYSQRELQSLRKAGYECALTLETGGNDASTDLTRIHRTPIPDNASVSELLVKASGAWDLFFPTTGEQPAISQTRHKMKTDHAGGAGLAQLKSSR